MERRSCKANTRERSNERQRSAEQRKEKELPPKKNKKKSSRIERELYIIEENYQR